MGSKSIEKINRLNEVALSAAEQSHRNVVPEVAYLNGLKALTQMNFDTKLVAYEESAKVGEERIWLKLSGRLHQANRLWQSLALRVALVNLKFHF